MPTRKQQLLAAPMPATPLTRLRADGRTLASGGVARAVAASYRAYPVSAALTQLGFYEAAPAAAPALVYDANWGYYIDANHSGGDVLLCQHPGAVLTIRIRFTVACRFVYRGLTDSSLADLPWTLDGQPFGTVLLSSGSASAGVYDQPPSAIIPAGEHVLEFTTTSGQTVLGDCFGFVPA